MGFHPDPSGQESSVGARSRHLSYSFLFLCGDTGLSPCRALGLWPPLQPAHSQRGDLSSPVPVEEEDWKQFGKWAVTYPAHIVRERPRKKKKPTIPPSNPEEALTSTKYRFDANKTFCGFQTVSAKKTNREIKGKSQRKDNFFLALLISLFGFHLSAFKMSFN